MTMKAKSKEDKIIRKTLADIKAPSPKELARVRKAMANSVDTAEIPSQIFPARYPLIRDSLGRIPKKPRSAIRDAILAELGRRNMTRYQLWKLANEHCPKLPNSAVYEFLLGKRAISVDYCEALLNALDLGIARLRQSA